MKSNLFQVSGLMVMVVVGLAIARSDSTLFAAEVENTVAALPDLSSSNQALRNQMVARGIQFLRQAQGEDGSYSAKYPAITALVTTSVLRSGVPARDPLVARSLEYLQRFVQDDGGIYDTDSVYRNYESCLAILCFTELKDPQYDELIARAEAFVRGLQWDEDLETAPESPAYGGAGYGNHKRPDLSNTGFLIEALKATGATEDDEDLQKALVFVSRTQNLESQYNTLPFPSKNPDGGFYYTPAAGGSSQAGETDNGGLRSYASMTYVGLKSMIYAGLSSDDLRVKAARQWIARHYGLDENPGMGQAGLFYYYHTFAKALHVQGEGVVVDNQGVSHDWRSDLLKILADKQNDNGSWVNPQDRWLEGDAALVTGYALLSLSYCQ